MESQAAGLDLTVAYLHEFELGEWFVHHLDLAIKHVGEFAGRPPSNAVARLAEVEAARVVDGRIAEMWSVADRLHAMRQLGFE